MAITPQVSFGIGLDYLYGKADYNGDLGAANTKTGDGIYANHLDGNTWGYNLGVGSQQHQHVQVSLIALIM